MAITVNTNVASLTAQKSLNNATTKMNTAMERLSTGIKINSSKDDAAGSAVSTKLEYKVSSLNVAGDNAQMGSSLLDTEEGTLDVIQSNMQRIRDLTEQAANGTYGTDAMTAIKSEITGRLAEVTRIAGTTEFNGKKLLDGSMDNGINLQVGIMSGDDSVINLKGSLFASTTAESLLGDYSFQGNSPAITGDASDGIEPMPAFDDGKGGKRFAKSSEATGNAVVFQCEGKIYLKIGNDYFEANETRTDADGVKYRVATKHITDEAELAKVKETFYDDSDAGIAKATRTNLSGKVTFVTGDAANKSYNAVDNLESIFTNDITARALLDNIDKALTNVTDRKTEIGAAQQRIASAMEVTNVMSTNLTAANSLIKDADIAEESSSYIKNQILQQTASSLLATANQNPSIAMSLI